MKKYFTVPFLALFVACGAGIAATEPATDKAFATALDAAIAGSWRSEAHKARDVYRHPKETLTFFGLRSGMTVVEMSPGGGWYTEILAPLSRSSGVKLIGAVEDPESASDSDVKAEYVRDYKAYADKLAADPARYSAVEVRKFSIVEPNFGKDGTVDAVLTFRNVHNYVMLKNDRAMFQAFFKVLKPGGVLGVTDHRASVGADVDKVKRLGYLPEAYVVKLATDAGFVLEARSEINANPKDTKDYARGVWTLPPTLDTAGEDKAKYLAIGESDRMTLKFRKPK